jgi:glycosyltransferase involved in cell wall biosynthesis
MNIAFYMPFKPLGHPHPSGDLIMGTELFGYLKAQGHRIESVSRLRSRWLYWRPWMLIKGLTEIIRSIRKARSIKANLWLTYHSYYKAPDIIGPICSRYLDIPYVIFQGIYSTKRRRKMKTLPGFWLNRSALKTADMVFSNKKEDHLNLNRIISSERLSYIAPGIHPEAFSFDPHSRTLIRSQWQINSTPVVMSAAMFRPGVKTQGLSIVIKTCGAIFREGQPLLLVIAGDGSAKQELKKLARIHLPERTIFLGKVSRKDIYKYLSAADVFAFPGINESLGMVYLEAQACGLPVVAFDRWGAKEAVVPGVTGLLNNAHFTLGFKANLFLLIKDEDLRRKMGKSAQKHILANHDLNKNYGQMLLSLEHLAEQKQFVGSLTHF